MYDLKELPNGEFNLRYYTTALVNSEIVDLTIHELRGNKSKISRFLKNQQIEENELKFAFSLIEDEGHNFVNFGVLGRVVFSKFDGIEQ